MRSSGAEISASDLAFLIDLPGARAGLTIDPSVAIPTAVAMRTTSRRAVVISDLPPTTLRPTGTVGETGRLLRLPGVFARRVARGYAPAKLLARRFAQGCRPTPAMPAS